MAIFFFNKKPTISWAMRNPALLKSKIAVFIDSDLVKNKLTALFYSIICWQHLLSALLCSIQLHFAPHR